jgi:hypothetical protein
MPVGPLVLFVLLGLPGLIALGLVLRIRAKERRRDAWRARVGERFLRAGAERAGPDLYRRDGRVARLQASTNPLLGDAFTVRLSAYSDSVDEFELRKGRPVPEGREAFAALLDRWDTAGKQGVECVLAAVTAREDLEEDLRALVGLAKRPCGRAYQGGVFTYREGFEPDCPQVHWRHDLRAKLPPGVRRACISYWADGPLLNPVLLRVLAELAPGLKSYFVTDVTDLDFLRHAFGAERVREHGTLVELDPVDPPWAADLTTDGRFFGGLFSAAAPPPGFDGRVPPWEWLERAIAALPSTACFVRRLDDDERAWYSGEYEILSLEPLPVRRAIETVALEIGATAMVIERRFNKRMVLPRNWD